MGLKIVTGANRGIGLELVRQLAARGDDVVAVCRKASPELAALGVRVEEGIDVSDPTAVRQLGERIGNAEVDLLVNNAGVLRADSLGSVDPESVRQQLAVNALGPLLVSQALAPKMKRGSKIAIVTSRMGSIADNTSGGYYGYRMSKAAVNAAGVSLARDLEGQGIAVVILHPGFVRTEMTGKNGNVEPADSAKGLLERIDELRIESTGRFLHMNGEELPW